MDESGLPCGPDASVIPSSTRLCGLCGKQDFEPMVVKAGVIWWWCSKCGYVWGEPLRSASKDGIQGE